MTENTPTPAVVAQAVASRRDFDIRREALHQGTRTVSEHYDKMPTTKRADTSATRADEIVSAATKYLVFLAAGTATSAMAIPAEVTPDGIPILRVLASEVAG